MEGLVEVMGMFAMATMFLKGLAIFLVVSAVVMAIVQR